MRLYVRCAAVLIGTAEAQNFNRGGLRMTRLIALAGFTLLMAGAAPVHALPTCEFQGIPLFILH